LSNEQLLHAWTVQVEYLYQHRQAERYGKVGVLLGGRSAEREISLLSGQAVLAALRNLGVDAQPFDPSIEPIQTLDQKGFHRVFISLHGRWGEDGSLQGLLDQIGMPYTGSGVLPSAIAIDKEVTKNIWRSQGLATPKFTMIHQETNWEALEHELGLPIIIKPSREGSSLGLTKVQTRSALPAAYVLAAKLDVDVMAEECIIGDELTCPLITMGSEVIALPTIRIKAQEANYDYHNKYFSNETQYFCPPQIDPMLEKQVEALAVAAFKALHCKGWGRADIMVDEKTGRPYLLEMNTSPGMTAHSLVPMAALQAGVSFEKLVLWILQQTLEGGE
jgi:D-alanine-D-alanine ligase